MAGTGYSRWLYLWRCPRGCLASDEPGRPLFVPLMRLRPDGGVDLVPTLERAAAWFKANPPRRPEWLKPVTLAEFRKV